MIDIAASAYKYIYFILITILTLVVYSKYSSYGSSPMYREEWNKGSAVLLVIVLILFIGFRPPSGKYFVDMSNYITHYIYLYEGVPFHFDTSVENIIFDNLFMWWGAVRLGYTSFFVLVSAIYFGVSYVGISRLFPNNTFAAYIVFLAAFSTFSYCTNGIKAGAAAAMFIWALSYRDNLWVCIPLVLITYGFHHSMQVPICAFFLTLLFKNPKYYFGGWVFCLLLAAAHVTFFQNIFAGMTDDHGAEYLTEVEGQEVAIGGFRIDFILYSMVPILIGYFAIFKKGIESKIYNTLLYTYITSNAVWLLCIYANFTNRIAYLSWCIYPIVLIYPFLNENWGEDRYRTFAKVMGYHLCFTLFMECIYYGILRS